MSFVHLHRHSEFSRLDGVGTAKQYAARAAELGQFALGQTDHGTMSGALHHIQACKGKDDKGNKLHDSVIPVNGVEAYFRPDRSNKITKQAWHLCLFAKNLRGWHNLMRLVSISHAEIEDGGGFYQYPVMDWELLKAHHEGLICTSACVASFLSQLVEWGDSQSVRDYIDAMLGIFGDDFWIEIMPHDFDDQRTLNLELVRIANERSIPLIATNDAHFPVKEWAETQRIAKIMGVRKTLAKVAKDVECGKADYLAELTPTLYLAHEEEMYLWFQKHHPDLSYDLVHEAMENTGALVSELVPFMLDQTAKLPEIPDLKKTTEDTLREWIDEGLQRLQEEYPDDHWGAWPYEVYVERVESEFVILQSKGVIDYFVMLGDVVRWAKAQGIRVGLGRGSAAGCLISYLVGITAIDPISYGLLFERFLNPERKGLPDIDMDFDSERRSEVKDYLAMKYGQDHVADIITHQRFQPKKLIGDLCRVYGVSLPETRAVTDTIEIRQDDEETTLEEILPLNQKLQEFKNKYPEIWEHALRLEGTVANAGKHAAGIIVTPKPIAEYMALERGKKGDLVTSWSDAADFAVISDYGFLKYDFLGIDGLSKHEYACRLIEQRTGEKIDLEKLPALRSPYAVDDDVLRGFAEGYTVGVFQFGSRGMTNLLREIEPSGATNDLIAANALYRPGPMKGGVTWDYAKRKHNIFLRSYWNEQVKPLLEETYGLVAYQEQVMQISKLLADFTGAEADDLRKAMGKLYRIKGGKAAKDFMGRFEEKWFSGTAEKGISRVLADEIWHKMLEFGHYGFNKSHSACYALQAYQDMWLKIKYPAEFYAAFLTYESGSKDSDVKCKAALREAKARGIEIVMPDINLSEAGYSVDDDERLILGLESIKGVGPNAAPEIIKNRPWLTLDDVLTRAGSKVPVRPLVESGALDSIADRKQLMSLVPKPLGPKKRKELEESGEEWPLWSIWEHLKHNTKLKNPKPVPDVEIEPRDDDLAMIQGQLLNLPMASLNLTEAQQEFLTTNCFTQDEVQEAEEGEDLIVGGEITKVTKKQTKKGAPFANVTLVFNQDEYAVKFWQESLIRFENLLEEGRIVMVAGTKNEWNGFIQVVANFVEDIGSIDTESEEAEVEPSTS
jgi:DNA polymerase-3 subunit alpha